MKLEETFELMSQLPAAKACENTNKESETVERSIDNVLKKLIKPSSSLLAMSLISNARQNPHSVIASI